MERYICIHGHFYQPPRENPWLEGIELQDSAYPYHDWNERITAECYATNGASRMLDGYGNIQRIVNNYARISFNFGPTLLSWMQAYAPSAYQSILAADRESQGYFSGHGSALAQAYNHMILPLANRRDIFTQVKWGVSDFQHRFGRMPEGMWLAETAVDIETLEVLAELGIAFTILSPYQAQRVREIPSDEPEPAESDEPESDEPDPAGVAESDEVGPAPEPAPEPEPAEPAPEPAELVEMAERAESDEPGTGVSAELAEPAEPEPEPEPAEPAPPPEPAWYDVSGGRIDPTMPYVQHLPSGRTITLFFYDGPIAQGVAFERLLIRGENLADRLAGAFSESRDWPQLVHIATDGETYGHHHRNGEMGLSYALQHIQENDLARLTIYGEYLENHPPTHEVEIIEKSSWSCVHGVERWRSDCGCNSGMHAEWDQQWRAPLREALDWLRDMVNPMYEEHARSFVEDPWQARDDYISVILDRSPENIEQFFARNAVRELDEGEQCTALKLLELQRHAMLMYTSCGWFFDEVSGIETVQIIQYAGRVIQLAAETLPETRQTLESGFLERLARAKSNIPENQDGAVIYEKFVKPAMVDLDKVTAHYAVSSLFNQQSDDETASIYCYDVASLERQVLESGRCRWLLGKAQVRSNITLERGLFSFGVLHLGDHNLAGGVRPYDDESHERVRHEMSEAFWHTEPSDMMRLLDHHFQGPTCSLLTLFRDEQRKILKVILESSLESAEASYRQIYDDNVELMRFLSDLHIPLPRVFRTAAEFILNVDLRRALETEDIDIERVRYALEDVRRSNIELESAELGYTFAQTLEWMEARILHNPTNLPLLQKFEAFVELARTLPFEVDFWKTQNIYHEIRETIFPDFRERASRGNEGALIWVEHFVALGRQLGFDTSDMGLYFL